MRQQNFGSTLSHDRQQFAGFVQGKQQNRNFWKSSQIVGELSFRPGEINRKCEICRILQTFTNIFRYVGQ